MMGQNLSHPQLAVAIAGVGAPHGEASLDTSCKEVRGTILAACTIDRTGVPLGAGRAT